MSVPLRTRLTGWYLTLFALVVGAWSLFVVLLVHVDLYSGVDRVLASRASQVVTAYGVDRGADFGEITASTLSGTPRVELAAQLLTRSGRLLDASGDRAGRLHLVRARALAAADVRRAPILQTVHAAGERFRVIVAKLPRSREFVLVGMSTETADEEVRRLVTVMLLTGPLALLFAGVGGWQLARRALRPVAEMAATAAGIGVEHLSERVPLPATHDELAELAATLNGMLSRLEAGVEQKRRLIADASHELQTPLAVMRTELDVSLATPGLGSEAIRVLESTREEADRMVRIVRNLLTLARFDEGSLRLLRSRVDLHALVERAADSLADLASRRRIRVDLHGGRVDVEGDQDYLQLVIVNLLENALEYSGEGSAVTITTERADGHATLTVSDTGVGIPAEALDRIFDRFYRVDPSHRRESGGSGLGLAITKDIVRAHGGRIDVTSVVGRGTTFTVTFAPGAEAA